MDKKKVLKIIMCMVLIMVIVIIIYFVRNYMIISKIAKMQEEAMRKDNYSYTLEIYPEKDYNEKTTIKYSYKDGKEKLECDGYIVEWFDKNNKEFISVSPFDNKVRIYKDKEHNNRNDF